MPRSSEVSGYPISLAGFGFRKCAVRAISLRQTERGFLQKIACSVSSGSTRCSSRRTTRHVHKRFETLIKGGPVLVLCTRIGAQYRVRSGYASSKLCYRLPRCIRSNSVVQKYGESLCALFVVRSLFNKHL